VTVTPLRQREECPWSDRTGGEVRVEPDGSTVRFKNGQTHVAVSIRSARIDGGMSAPSIADGLGPRRLQARFTFSGEQHFYGLGQGGWQLDRLGVTRQLWNTHLGHGPGSDMGVAPAVSTTAL
jgi:hypothetical protein